MLRLGRRFASTSALKRPQYNLKDLRANPSIYQESVKKREVVLPNNVDVPAVVENYNELIRAQEARNSLVNERNKVQKLLVTEKKPEYKQQLVQLKASIKHEEQVAQSLKAPVMEAIESIPNLISPDVGPEQQILDMINPDKKTENVASSEPLDHVDIALRFGLIDLASASAVSGSSWYYLMNDGALLEQALVQYGLSKARKHGFAPITPPSIVRQEFTNACGFKPRDQNNEQQIYQIAAADGASSSNLCLTGTAEIALAGWAAQKTLHLESNQPLKKVGVSRSYRAEAGAGGRDVKGLYRVHEFTKVELFCWTRDSVEESSRVHDQLLELQKEMIRELGLCARVLNMPYNDLGAPAYKKYDIEAWMPGRGDWGEVTSASNCLDYQSRRLHTKYAKQDGTTAFTHTLNGTAIAVPRLIVAILENNYDPVGDRISIPEVLRRWMDDREYIEPHGC